MEEKIIVTKENMEEVSIKLKEFINGKLLIATTSVLLDSETIVRETETSEIHVADSQRVMVKYTPWGKDKPVGSIDLYIQYTRNGDLYPCIEYIGENHILLFKILKDWSRLYLIRGECLGKSVNTVFTLI